ncbi:MAG: hypothetical protein IID33_09235 [Planctomycetes bacterium]|nr:hypothetical protein [Planctomycetota bacterium]
MTSLLYVCGLGLIFLAAVYWALQQAGVVVDLEITELLVAIGALLLAGGVVMLWHKVRS